MKRLLALILALILCFGLLVSCNEEEQSSSEVSSSSSDEATSGESSSTESSSQEPSTKDDLVDELYPQKGTLSGVTKESLGAYTSLLDCHSIAIENGTTVVSTYDDFLTYVHPSYTEALEGITEETFEDNFIVLVKGTSGHIRDEDIYYNDFKKVGNNYILTYNLVYEKGQLVSPMEYPYVDVCIIPRSLCVDELSSLQVKIERKEYLFEIGKTFNSDCEVITYLPK